ncbi:hypothetical protein ACNFJN_17410 [Xenorhabdus budapestensis]
MLFCWLLVLVALWVQYYMKVEPCKSS